MKLSKSLAELDAAANELLAKSKAAENTESEETEDTGLTPDEVSEDSTPTPEEDTENSETSEEDETEDTKKSNCGDSDLKKSDDSDTDEVDDDDEMEKSCSCNNGMKKSEDSDDEVEGEDEDSEEVTPADLEKSIRDDFESDESIRQGMENSEFYAAVVDIFAKSLGDMQYDVQHTGRAQAAATEVLVKSLQAVMQTNRMLQADNDRLTRRITKLEKSINQGFERIMDSLDDISSQPVGMRKSLASISVHDRDFDRSLNGQKTIGGFDSLSKSQVLDILNSELYSGNQNVTAQDIISYESGAPLRPNLQALVASKCK